MGIKVFQNGRKRTLNRLLRGATAPSFKVGLFSNDYTPADSDDPSFTITESTFSGYTRLTPSFGSDATDTGSAASIVGTSVIFAADSGIGAPETAYGYFLWDEAAGEYFGAERFTAPFTFTNDGDARSVTAKINLGDQ